MAFAMILCGRVSYAIDVVDGRSCCVFVGARHDGEVGIFLPGLPRLSDESFLI
jgi:hypothetical protein